MINDERSCEIVEPEPQTLDAVSLDELMKAV
jgi:hypothetical protein